MKTKMFISKYETQIYALLRIIAGFLFLWHGSQKLLGYPAAGFVIPLTFTVLIGGIVELAGGIMVMVGLWTRWVAFICSGEMAYAYWTAHATHAVLPLVNHGELAVLYCFLFLFISARGSGIFSIDHVLEKSRQNKDVK